MAAVARTQNLLMGSAFVAGCVSFARILLEHQRLGWPGRLDVELFWDEEKARALFGQLGRSGVDDYVAMYADGVFPLYYVAILSILVYKTFYPSVAAPIFVAACLAAGCLDTIENVCILQLLHTWPDWSAPSEDKSPFDEDVFAETGSDVDQAARPVVDAARVRLHNLPFVFGPISTVAKFTLIALIIMVLWCASFVKLGAFVSSRFAEPDADADIADVSAPSEAVVPKKKSKKSKKSD